MSLTAYTTLLIASSWAKSAVGFFVRLGAPGFFLLEALNSSFFYLPLANELLMLSFVREERGTAAWALFVTMSALGSAAGALLIDLPTRKAGEKGLERFVAAERVKRLKKRLKERAGWALLLASTLPPPFPHRPLVLTASALQTPRRVMLPAIFAGRLVRFAAEAALVLHFGHRLVRYMESDAFDYVLYTLGAAAVAGTAFTLYKWAGGKTRRKRKR